MSLYKGGLRIKEQHEIVIDGFRFPKHEPFLDGDEKMFYAKAIMFALFLLGMKFLFDVFLPGIISIIAMVLFIPLFVMLLFKIIMDFNKKISQSNFAFITHFLLILGLMALSGVSYVFIH